jgi:hypothetical protein
MQDGFPGSRERDVVVSRRDRAVVVDWAPSELFLG